MRIDDLALARNGNSLAAQKQVPLPVQTPLKMEIIASGDTTGESETSDAASKRKWTRKPLNKKAKRLRQNRRLRKLLIPKNALMSLHELMGSSISEYRIMPEERGFVAQVLVNNIQYEGRGMWL